MRILEKVGGALLALPALLFLSVISCIDRSNPFDPLNALSPVPVIREEYKPGLDAITRSATGLAASLEGDRTAFQQQMSANARRQGENQGRREENKRRDTANFAVEAHNSAQTSPDALQLKQELILLEPLLAYGPFDRLQADYDSLKAVAVRIERYMEQANARHLPTLVYPAAYQDSVLAPYRRDESAIDTLLAEVEAGNRAVAIDNGTIKEYNDSIGAVNRGIRSFNQEVAFRKEARPEKIITLADSLSKATMSAAPGDTLYLDSGSFAVDLRFTNGTAEKPIVIRGFPGHQTILRPSGTNVPQAGIIEQSHIHFEDLVFRGGSSSGIKLNDSGSGGRGSRGVVFRRCLFDSNGVWGVDAAGSDVLLKDCEIRANGGGALGVGKKTGGIRAETFSCAECRIDLNNVLIVRNQGVGIEAISPRGNISRSTISDNSSDGLQIVSTRRNLTISSTIISGNGGFGLNRDPIFEIQEDLTMDAYDVWNNAGGNWSLVNLDSTRARKLMDDNIDVDPGFVNPLAFDYSLHPGSGLLVFEKSPPFVIIGYRRQP